MSLILIFLVCLGNVVQMCFGLLGAGMAARATQLPCFVAGTLVSTPDGPRPIETILSGDTVCGFDQRRGQWRSCMVSYHSAIAYDDLVVTVRARLPKSSETSEVCELAEVRSTYHHPYWVVSGEELDERPVPDQLDELGMSIEGVEGRWVDAGDLRVGDVLVSRGGGQSTVESVETAHTPTTVYHIYVEDLHNYAVGDSEWLVHNAHTKRDPKTGKFVSDPANPPSPHVMTDAQRRAHWKRLANDPDSPLDEVQRQQIRDRGHRGPQRENKYGETETMELSHEPIPLRYGGTDVVPRWPEDHAAIDEFRRLLKRN